MAETTTNPKLEHVRALLDVHIAAAWLRRNGIATEIDPQEAGEFMDILELGGLEITVAGIWATLRPDGSPSGWSKSFGRYGSGTDAPIEEWWEWTVNAGWDNCSQDEIVALEDLGACFDDRRSTFMTKGSHKERPTITEELLQALVLLWEKDV